MVWIVEVGVIEDIERFAAKLQALVFGAQREAFRKSEIEIDEGRAGKSVAPFCAEGRAEELGGRRGKGTLIEPGLGFPDLGRRDSCGVGSHGSGFCWIAYEVGPFRISEGCGRGRGRTRQNHCKG